MSAVFKFKQFEVDQTDCAMKINTDGVLLAAMAEGDDPRHILDIGTGTGVLALMLAQRFPTAQVEAVEIDKLAAETANRNFGLSVFSSRLAIHHVAIEQYSCAERFELIISNPPYFVNDLKNIEVRKGLARHTDAIFFDELIAKVTSLLTDNGKFWFILPVKQAALLIEKANLHGLFVHKQVYLHSDEAKSAFRWIVCLAKDQFKATIEHFYIYESEKKYTLAYQVLLKDFFLGY